MTDPMLYVAVGRDSDDTGLQAFEVYDVDTREWTTLPDVPTGRSGIAAAAFDGHIYVFGGETFDPGNTATYREAERFDPATGEWEQVTSMRVPRHGLGVGVLDDGIVLVSGGPSPGFTFSGVTEFWQP